jgi:hypothetical protein
MSKLEKLGSYFTQLELQHPLRLLENSYTPKDQPDKVFRIPYQAVTFQN